MLTFINDFSEKLNSRLNRVNVPLNGSKPLNISENAAFVKCVRAVSILRFYRVGCHPENWVCGRLRLVRTVIGKTGTRYRRATVHQIFADLNRGSPRMIFERTVHITQHLMDRERLNRTGTLALAKNHVV